MKCVRLHIKNTQLLNIPADKQNKLTKETLHFPPIGNAFVCQGNLDI